MISLKAAFLTLAIAASVALASKAPVSPPVDMPLPNSPSHPKMLQQRTSSCDKQEVDTICSPSTGTPLSGTFDVKFHARDDTEYIELAFYSTDLKHKYPINERYSTKESGKENIFKASDVSIPCSLRGNYILAVIIQQSVILFNATPSDDFSPLLPPFHAQ